MVHVYSMLGVLVDICLVVCRSCLGVGRLSILKGQKQKKAIWRPVGRSQARSAWGIAAFCRGLLASHVACLSLKIACAARPCQGQTGLARGGCSLAGTTERIARGKRAATKGGQKGGQ